MELTYDIVETLRNLSTTDFPTTGDQKAKSHEDSALHH